MSRVEESPAKFTRYLAHLFILVVGLLFVSAPAMAKNPYAKPDDTWITISGTVKTVKANSFTLDYGEGLIIVEMDDGDRDADGYKLLAGDKVTVNGKIDDDFYETATIEASSVYVEKIGTTFFASAADEEDALVTVVAPVIVSSVTLKGTVTDVNDDEFTLNTGLQSITVEVEEMPFNPLDDEGYLKIETGDFVQVNGTVDDDFIEGREVVADFIIELTD